MIKLADGYTGRGGGPLELLFGIHLIVFVAWCRVHRELFLHVTHSSQLK